MFKDEFSPQAGAEGVTFYKLSAVSETWSRVSP